MSPSPTRSESVAATSPVTRASSPPFGITLWLIFSALMSTAGWVLSALGQLNARGYTIVLALTAIAFVGWRRGKLFTDFRCIKPSRLMRRFKRPFAMGYLILALISLVGGLIYLPTNYDALAYRVPRVLHWLAHNQWHWIHTSFPRVDVRACGYEWLMAPLLILTESMRWLFLPSIISYFLLPGLLYSVFTRFGIRPRIAWNWMWITSSGYGYVSQAGGIANDLLGAVYILAAFDFGLRMWQYRNMGDLWLFVIATALATGAKASNFPLLLPLFLLFCPRWQLLLVQPVRTFIIIIFAAMASFAPTAFFNLKYAHDWSGMTLEGPMKPALNQLGINTTGLIINNLAPPVFPFTAQWTALMHKIPGLSGEAVACFGIPEITAEEGGGIGAGVLLLLIISVIATRRLRHQSSRQKAASSLPKYWKLILWSPFISLLAYALKAQAVHSASRLIIPYYAVLMVPVLLFGFDAKLIRQRWWRCLVGIVFAVAIGVMILIPARPLWPAKTVLAHLKASHPSSALITRAQSVYRLYRERPHSFAPLVAALPKDDTVFGFMTFDDPETSLWWPLGSRRIEHVAFTDTREEVYARGFKYLIVPAFCAAMPTPVEDIIRRYDAQVVVKVPLFLRSNQGWMDWYVLKINPAPAADGHL